MRSSGTLFQDLNRAMHTEWLETNGLGDYASSTAIACNARRYHGLLVANLPYIGRHVLLSNLEDWLVTSKGTFPLSCRHHPGTTYPEGNRYLVSWETVPYPSFTYEVEDWRVTRSVQLVKGRHAVLVRYHLDALNAHAARETPVLRVSPLLAFRNFHQLTHANLDLQVKTYPSSYGFKIQPYNGLPPIYIRAEGHFTFLPSPDWINAVEYPLEQERGFDYAEDIFSPGLFEIDLPADRDVFLSASTDRLRVLDTEKKTWGIPVPANSADVTEENLLSSMWDAQLQLREERVSAIWNGNVREMLAAQNEAFLIRTPMGRSTTIAGYPWFGSWGRDTIISLPGTTFFAHRRGAGMSMLKRMAELSSDGLIPNTYSPNGKPAGYNCVDASLWYAWCIRQLLLSVAGRPGFAEWKKERLDEYAPMVYAIIDAYRAGRVPFVREDAQGLLDVGTPSTQLTWMDAQVDGKPVTPRNGYPVEIQALWYNTLAFAHSMAIARGDEDPCPVSRLKAMKETFLARFRKEDGTLYDVWRPEEDGGPDPAVRPNQLFAISMPSPILEPRKAKPVIDQVKAELLTPYGLRTLSPADPQFCPVYEGGPAQRDAAYHQGTVWAWLLGPYADALVATVAATTRKDRRDKAVARAVGDLLKTITPLLTDHLREAGVGYLSEIFSATAPYRPDGCIAQAWSGAEVLRALVTLRRASRETYEAWEKKISSKGAK